MSGALKHASARRAYNDRAALISSTRRRSFCWRRSSTASIRRRSQNLDRSLLFLRASRSSDLLLAKSQMEQRGHTRQRQATVSALDHLKYPSYCVLTLPTCTSPPRSGLCREVQGEGQYLSLTPRIRLLDSQQLQWHWLECCSPWPECPEPCSASVRGLCALWSWSYRL